MNNIALNEETLKHLTQKIVDTIPTKTSDLENNSDFISKSYTDRKIRNMKTPGGADKSVLDDNAKAGNKTWSSKKIQDRAMEFEDLIWQEVEGVNPTVENSKVGYMKEIEIFGDTWQDSDGKNLINLKSAILSDMDGDSGKPKPGKTTHIIDDFIEIKDTNNFYVCCEKDIPSTLSGESVMLYFYDVDKNYLGSGTRYGFTTKIIKTTLTKIEIRAKDAKYFKIRIANPGLELLKEYGLYMGGKVEKYEPYHKADLSDIHHVGEPMGDGTYRVEVKTIGKNIFDPSEWENKETIDGRLACVFHGWYNGDKDKNGNPLIFKFKTPVTPGTLISIFCSNKATNHFNKFWLVDSKTGRRQEIVNNTIKGVWTETIGDTIANNIYDCIVCATGDPSAMGYIDKLSIVIGETINQYIPHHSSKQTLFLPCQLSKVRDVQDRLYWNGSKYIIEKNIKEAVLNGSENWLKTNWDLPETMCFNTKDIKCRINEEPHINNTFKASTKYNYGTDEESTYVNISALFIRVNRTKLEPQSIEGLKKWLGENNITIYYQSPEPQLIEAEITEQIFPSTYKDKTHFFINGGKMTPKIKCKVPVSAGGVITTLIQEAADLQKEVENAKEKNKTQDKAIIDNMLAIDNLLTSTVNLVTTLDDDVQIECENIVKLYEKMVEMGLVDQVPLIYRNLILK